MNDYPQFDFDWMDEDYRYLDDKIRGLVKALHQFRIGTIASCEGHIRESWIYSGVLPYPWVIIILNPNDLKRLEAKLRQWNRQNPDKRWILSTERIHGSFTPEYIRSDITYGNDSLTVTALVSEDDNERLLSADVLAQFQRQVPILASFISGLT